eukprot:1920166-Prymnesium_polylepis.1
MLGNLGAGPGVLTNAGRPAHAPNVNELNAQELQLCQVANIHESQYKSTPWATPTIHNALKRFDARLSQIIADGPNLPPNHVKSP